MTGALEAKAQKKPVVRGKKQAENPFVRYELSAEEKAALRTAVNGGLDVWDLLGKFIQTDYKLSLSWDEYSNSPVCFVFPRGEKDANFGAILTGRGRTIQGAVLEAAFKHFVVFDGVWPRATRGADAEFWDD